MTIAATVSIASCMLCIYEAIRSARLGAAPGWRQARWFAVVALTAGLFTAANVSLTAGGSDRVVLIISQCQLAVAGANVAAWWIYSRMRLGAPASPRIALALLVLSALALVPGVVFSGRIVDLHNDLLGVTYRVTEPTAFGEVLFGLFCLAFLLISIRYASAWRRGVAGAGGGFIGMVILLGTAVNDSLVISRAYDAPFLLDIGYMVLIGIFAVVQTSETARDKVALASLSSTLEHRVEERTRELRTSEDALRHETALYEGLLKAQSEIGDGVIVVDRSRIAYANDACSRLSGYSAEELRTLPSVFELIAPEDRAMVIERAEQRIAGRESSDLGEMSLLRKDGGRLSAEYAATTLRVGDRTQIFLVVRDVTERKAMRGRLMVADRMASLGLLSRGMAHEINNPLSYVMANLGYVIDELRRRSPADAEDGRGDLLEALNEASQGAGRVRDIVRGLTAFSGAEDAVRGPIDPRVILDLCLQLAGNEVRHRARVVTDYQTDRRVIANEGGLGQVFVNLLMNAAHAVAEGQADANEIRIVTRMRGEDMLAIEVHDTGAGIPADVRPRIFDPFFTTKPIGQGTGLGLWICHTIVRGLNGEIEVDRAPAGGSVFRVLLPVAAAGNAVELPRAPPTPSPRRAHVLLVDDEPMVLAAYRRILAEEHEVDVASDGLEALERLAGRRYDVIVCDLMMQRMNGMDLHAELSRRDPDMAARIVFLTGGAFTTSAQDFKHRSTNQWLDKPVAAVSLLGAVRAMLWDDRD